MSKKKYGFSKKERLCQKSLIEQLFKKPDITFFLYPFKVVVLFDKTPASRDFIPILISVSKKKIPKSVQRNKLKRRIREAYRTKKHILYSKNITSTISALAFIYSAKKELNFSIIDSSFHQIIEKITNRIVSN